MTRRELQAHPHFETVAERGREAFKNDLERLNAVNSTRTLTGRVLPDLTKQS